MKSNFFMKSIFQMRETTSKRERKGRFLQIYRFQVSNPNVDEKIQMKPEMHYLICAPFVSTDESQGLFYLASGSEGQLIVKNSKSFNMDFIKNEANFTLVNDLEEEDDPNLILDEKEELKIQASTFYLGRLLVLVFYYNYKI